MYGLTIEDGVYVRGGEGEAEKRLPIQSSMTCWPEAKILTVREQCNSRAERAMQQ